MFDWAASFKFSGRGKKFCYCPQCPAIPRIHWVKYIFLCTSSRPGLKLTDLLLMPMSRMCEVNFHCSILLYDLVMNQAHGIYNALTMLHKRLQNLLTAHSTIVWLHQFIACMHMLSAVARTQHLLSVCKIKTVKSCVIEWLPFIVYSTQKEIQYSIT